MCVAVQEHGSNASDLQPVVAVEKVTQKYNVIVFKKVVFFLVCWKGCVFCLGFFFSFKSLPILLSLVAVQETLCLLSPV